MTIPELYQLFVKHPIICTDTRKLSAGCLFFALKGDNFNGNLFAKKAIEAGAAFVVIDENQTEMPPKKRQSTNPAQKKCAKTCHPFEGATIHSQSR